MLKSILGVLILTIGLASCRPEDGRIVNGTNAPEGKYGFMLAVVHKSNVDFAFCGASLVASCWAATAAHCMEGEKAENLAMRYMATELNSKNKFTVPVRDFYVHEGYNALNYFANDIAMVKLKYSLYYHSGLYPVALSQNSINFPAKEGDYLPAIQIGWGLNKAGGFPQNHLQEVNLTVYSYPECHRLMRGHVNRCQICSGVNNGGAGPCQGDSGGPLFVYDGLKYILIGMTSWGAGKCSESPMSATVNTYVGCHLPWMSNIMSTAGRC